MREYLLVMFVTAAVTYLLMPPVRRFAIAAGAMPPIRARDVHKEPTPRLGGIAMFGGLCAGLLVADHLSDLHTVFSDSHDARALLSGAAIVWLLGVVDDKWGVDALLKLGGQILAAGVMVLQGIQILWLPIPGYGTLSLPAMQGTILTVALIVVTMNAVNFVDGLDGLAAGMVCIAAIAFFVYAYRLWYGYTLAPAAPATLFSAILIGMCIGFLPHNLHPARIFMGDSGALLIGLVLAASSASLSGQIDPELLGPLTGSATGTTHKLVPVYIPLLLPFVVIAVPLVDMVLAVVRRTKAGRSPFSADKQHLHHRLLEMGHSYSRAVLIMYFWSALLAFGAVAFSVRSGHRVIVFAAIALTAVGLVILLVPRFKPHTPAVLDHFVPPRYRERRRRARAAKCAGTAPPPASPVAPVAPVAQGREAATPLRKGVHPDGG